MTQTKLTRILALLMTVLFSLSPTAFAEKVNDANDEAYDAVHYAEDAGGEEGDGSNDDVENDAEDEGDKIFDAADHVNDARKTLKLVDKVNDARSPSNSIKRMFSSKKGAYGGSRYTEQAGDVILDSHQTQHIKRSLSESALQKSTKNSDKSLFSNKVDHQEIVSDTFKTGTKVKTDVIVKKYDYPVGYSKGSPTNYVQVQITDLSKNSMHGFPIDKQSYLKRLNGVR